MKDSARYVKIVEWSDEDQCYVGSSPGLVYGGCHGNDEQEVFKELCQIVDEAIELYRQDGKPLPPATSGRDFANKMQETCALHRIRGWARDEMECLSSRPRTPLRGLRGLLRVDRHWRVRHRSRIRIGPCGARSVWVY